MKTVCAANNLICSVQQVMPTEPLGIIGLICGVFVVVSIIRFVFMS